MHLYEYLEWKKSYVKPGTYPNYERWVMRFHNIVQKPEENFTIDDVSRFRDFLRSAEYSPKNIQYGLSLVRDYLNYLNNLHELGFPLSLFRIKQERSKSHYAVTREEFEKMDATVETHEPVPLQRKLMLNLLYETGVRGGELLSLKLSDISHRKAIIRNEKNHRNRMVGWSDKTERLLQFYLLMRVHLKTSEEWLFVSFKWKPCRKMTTRQLERIMVELRTKAKLKVLIRPHSFRHGFVHRKLEEGTPITTVSQMLGHSSTMNVMNYAQLTSRELHKAWGIESLD